jgi:hypothetical protein
LPSRVSQAIFAVCLPVAAYLLMPDVDTTIRCQLFTFAGFAFFLYLLKRHSEGRLTYGIWLMPLYMILWANLHGGFIMGLGLLGLYLLYYWFTHRTRQAESVAIVLFLSALATITNPYGLRFWQTMVSAWILPREHIAEWGNILSLDLPWYGLLYTALFLFALLLGFTQWRRTRDKFPLSLILLFFTGAYGWLHYKLAPLFLLTFLSIGMDSLDEDLAVLGPWLPARFHSLKQAASRWFPTMTLWGITALLVLGLFLIGFYWRSHTNALAVRVPGLHAQNTTEDAKSFSYPLGVTGYILRQEIHGNLWVPFAWGEFMYWVLYPQCRISIDGRYETLYNERLFMHYYRFYHPPYLVETAERYPTTHILIDTTHPVLIQKLRANKRWTEIYHDPQAILFSLRPGSYPGLPEIGQKPTAGLTLDQFRGDLTRFKSLVGI